MLCTCVSEEGGDGEGVGSEESSLLSYTLRRLSPGRVAKTDALSSQVRSQVFWTP
jgi:hypothetical protein